MEKKAVDNSPIVLYDGVCNFCNAVVNFIIKHDKEKIFLFAPIQSKEARNLLRKHNEAFASLHTVYLIEDKKVYKRSVAVFGILKKLPFPWNSISFLGLLPIGLTDFAYKLIAKYRYSIFGKKDSLIEPDERIKQRFIMNR
jgi:predicted DCC family thiol-disulfide oxidoreductase YuxK